MKNNFTIETAKDIEKIEFDAEAERILRFVFQNNMDNALNDYLEDRILDANEKGEKITAQDVNYIVKNDEGLHSIVLTCAEKIELAGIELNSMSSGLCAFIADQYDPADSLEIVRDMVLRSHEFGSLADACEFYGVKNETELSRTVHAYDFDFFEKSKVYTMDH